MSQSSVVLLVSPERNHLVPDQDGAATARHNSQLAGRSNGDSDRTAAAAAASAGTRQGAPACAMSAATAKPASSSSQLSEHRCPAPEAHSAVPAAAPQHAPASAPGSAASALLERLRRDARAATEAAEQAELAATRERLEILHRACWQPRRTAAATLRFVSVMRLTEGQFWEADHITPVAEGGGRSGVLNYRTLCVSCHRQATAALAKRLAKRRQLLPSHASGTAALSLHGPAGQALPASLALSGQAENLGDRILAVLDQSTDVSSLQASAAPSQATPASCDSGALTRSAGRQRIVACEGSAAASQEGEAPSPVPRLPCLSPDLSPGESQ